MTACKSASSPVLFTKRSCNIVAHELANLAFSLGEKFWIDEIPCQLDPLVESDVIYSVIME